MVFGQSGGGAKIATMMGMPAARGLCHRAATMSGQQVTASGPLHATARTRAFLGRLGIVEDDLSPLLATPAERLVEAGEATDPTIGRASCRSRVCLYALLLGVHVSLKTKPSTHSECS